MDIINTNSKLCPICLDAIKPETDTISTVVDFSTQTDKIGQKIITLNKSFGQEHSLFSFTGKEKSDPIVPHNFHKKCLDQHLKTSNKNPRSNDSSLNRVYFEIHRYLHVSYNVST